MRRFLAAIALLATTVIAQAQTDAPDIAPFPGPEVASIPATTKPNVAFSLQTPLETVAANPAGAAVIDKNIPGLLEDPRFDEFKGMNLSQLASLSDGQITDQMLAQTEADLKTLSIGAPPGQ